MLLRYRPAEGTPRGRARQRAATLWSPGQQRRLHVAWSRVTPSWGWHSTTAATFTHGMKINVSGILYDLVPHHLTARTSVWTWRKSKDPPTSTDPSLSSPAGRLTLPVRLHAIPGDRRLRGGEANAGYYFSPGLWLPALHPNPVEYADLVTTTVHKTLVARAAQ